MGQKVYPLAGRLPIRADSGESAGSRVRLWKLDLKELAWQCVDQSGGHHQPHCGDHRRNPTRGCSELNTRVYPQAIKVLEKELAPIKLRRDQFHGDWNYETFPRQVTR